MTQFEAVVEYAGKRVKVKSDSFEELHAALAGVEELNQDAEYLRREQDIDDVIPVYRRDDDDNEYFGLQDRRSRKNVTYGTKRGEALIPFFPKGADGYYDPDAMGPRGGGGDRRRNEPRRQNGSRQQNGARQQRAERQAQERAQERSSERQSAERHRREIPEREQQQLGETNAPASGDDLPF
jgi:hypothetical protein